MATIQLGSTKSASQLSNYAEKKAAVKDGYNLDIDYAKSQMKQTRDLFAKDDGIQAHHVIQSFQPGEVTPEKANEVGLELAKKMAPDHEVAVYTHDDRNHIHNHVVINSVNFETGKKFQAHGKEAIEHARSLSDEVCQEHDLSIVKEFEAPVRHTLTEQHLLEKNQSSWKEQLREAVEDSRDNSATFDDFKKHLEDVYGVETKLRGKTLSFKHPEQQRFTRAKKLGFDYEREGLERVFTRQSEREQEHDRAFRGNKGIEQDADQLYQSTDERGDAERRDDSHSVGADSKDIERGHEQHAVDLDQARDVIEAKRRELARNTDRWLQANSREQQQNTPGLERDSGRKQRAASRDEQRDNDKHQEHGKEKQRSRQKSKTRSDELSL